MPAHDDSTLEKTDGAPYGFGIKSLFNTHSSYRFGVDDTGPDTEPKVERQWWQEEKYPVQLSHEDVVKASWDKYYKDNRIPGNGTKMEDGEQNDSMFNSNDV